MARLPWQNERVWCHANERWRPWIRLRLRSTIKVHLKEIRERLDHAASIARAAQTCAHTGNIEKGVEIALDIEQLIYEVNTFLNAASLVNRINKT